MKTLNILLWILLTIFVLKPVYLVSAEENLNSEKKIIAIEWNGGQPAGNIEIMNGELENITIIKGQGKIESNQFSFTTNDPSRIEITLSNIHVQPGPNATIVSVQTDKNPFSFFLRDINREYPVIMPEYNVVVTESRDNRSFTEIEKDIQSRGLQTNLQRIEREPEESFESASVHTRNQPCPTWLGLSRDIRIFEITYGLGDGFGEYDIIRPKMASAPVKIPETNDRAVTYSFVTGRGQGPVLDVSRRLEEGVLPILHTTLIDEDIKYHAVAFVSLEFSPLTQKTLRGTHYIVADQCSYGHMFTKEQEELIQSRLPDEMNRTEETVLYFRVEAVNTASVPRYAWFKTLLPRAENAGVSYSFDAKSGFSNFQSGQVFCVSKLNGRPLPNEEIAVLLKPGETASFEFFLPHRPITKGRAQQLVNQSFDARHTECRDFWKQKLANAANIKLPEKRIEEMIRAGLLHLDLITYGLEPDSTLAPMIGVYSPIGTESSPIIQFMNSMGLHDVARRSLQYFLDKQHEDGLIQNFGGYMVETGAALWSMGEYYRYTNDNDWVKKITPKLLKSCEYLLRWRERNKLETLRDKGYGMIDGKVADPNDMYHLFMLNGYAYLGISRVAEMLTSVDPVNSDRLRQEADFWKQDIRTAFFKSMAKSPIIPLGNGTWCPTVAPWAETRGLLALYLEPGNWFSHGTFSARDAMLGPLYLIFTEVIEPDERAAQWMLNYHSELFYQRNAAFSQPYYSRHAWIQLKMGLVKPFLKTYYNTFSGLADRETYTFWEHLFHVSVHKTHEEGWFLMQTRWMLYMEERQTLKLLPGIPRAWLEDGKQIQLNNVASYFGPVTLHVTSEIQKGWIDATVECTSDRRPESVVVRLPHPDGQKPLRVTGGVYNDKTETVKIEPFMGRAHVKLEF